MFFLRIPIILKKKGKNTLNFKTGHGGFFSPISINPEGFNLIVGPFFTFCSVIFRETETTPFIFFLFLVMFVLIVFCWIWFDLVGFLRQMTSGM